MWTYARGGAPDWPSEAAYDDAYRQWQRDLRSLQVNHRTPILGLHNHSGCHHHLDGLETLCDRPCHLEETNRQRRERAVNLRAARQAYQDGNEDAAAQLTMRLFEVG